MNDPNASLKLLSGRLCPWLQTSLEALEDAHDAKRLGHAWLLTGPSGIGKLNLALVVADRLLAGRTRSAPPEALEPADAAAAMAARHTPQDRHADLHWLFPEEGKTTISVEQVRNVIDALTRSSYHGRSKVVIVEPVEAMTIAAANAFLKTLEEPAGDAYMLLVSHQPGRVPSTIRSRCQTLALAPPTAEVARQWLGSLEAGAAAFGYLGRSPLDLVKLAHEKKYLIINELEEQLDFIYEYKSDPLTIADEWLKLDLELVLEWLAMRVRQCIRSRMAARNSKPLKDTGNGPLPNDLPLLTLRTLFEHSQAIDKLRDQVGTGINVELAMRVLLPGFQPDRAGH